MLKKIAKPSVERAKAHYAIVAARYNSLYTDSLVKAAVAELERSGAGAIDVIRVPGSFEIPAVAARLVLARNARYDVIICFGVIFQGETSHAQNISGAVSNALALLQIEARRPIIHGVLHFQNEAQARVRCLGTEHNRGVEAARTAIEMAVVFRSLP